jgi:hypothetical protein
VASVEKQQRLHEASSKQQSAQRCTGSGWPSWAAADSNATSVVNHAATRDAQCSTWIKHLTYRRLLLRRVGWEVRKDCSTHRGLRSSSPRRCCKAINKQRSQDFAEAHYGQKFAPANAREGVLDTVPPVFVTRNGISSRDDFRPARHRM